METEPINQRYQKGGKSDLCLASKTPLPDFAAVYQHIFETAINYETNNQEWLDYINVLIL